MRPWREPRLVAWLRAGWLAAFVVLLTACGASPLEACPAIGYSRTVTVMLADDWPPGEGRTATVDCEEPCAHVLPDEGHDDHLTVPFADNMVAFEWIGASDDIVVTVHEPAGAVAEVQAELNWQRVGGTAQCGGPTEATVIIPAS